MNKTFNVACIQHCAGNDLDKNILATTELIRAAHRAGARLICLPENFSFLEINDQRLLAGAFTEETHPAIPHFRALAAELHVWLLLGSLAIKLPSGKLHNRSYLLDARGDIVARYNKLHRFDVSLRIGESYRESAAIEAGDRAVVATTPWGGLGLSICYDVRFAYLYRALAQAGALSRGPRSLYPDYRGSTLAYPRARPRHRDRQLCLCAGPVRGAPEWSGYLWPLSYGRPVGKDSGRRGRRTGFYYG